MDRHPIDIVSAALGTLVVVLGGLVAAGALGDVDSGNGWWIALGVLIVGLAIIPWRGTPRVEPPPAHVDDVPPVASPDRET